MSDILSRLQQQGAGLSNIQNRGEEIIQGFDTDKLMAQGQQYAYNMGKKQLAALVGSEAAVGLTHGVPVIYKGGRAIAQRLAGMPTTREEATARARPAVTTETPQGAPPDRDWETMC